MTGKTWPKKLFLILTLLPLLVLTSCPQPASPSSKNNGNGTKISFVLDLGLAPADDSGSRWIISNDDVGNIVSASAPDYYLVEFLSYADSWPTNPTQPSVNPLRADGPAFTTPSVTVEAGTWNISVTAFNSSDEIIGYVEDSLYIDETVSHTVTSYRTFGQFAGCSGSGSLDLTVDWGSLTNLSTSVDGVIYQLTSEDGTDYTSSLPSPTINAGVTTSVSFSNISLPSGSYIFAFYAMEGPEPVATPGTTSIRIYDDVRIQHILQAEDTDERPLIEVPATISVDTVFDPFSAFGGIEVMWDTTNNLFEDYYIIDRYVDSVGTWDNGYYVTSDPSTAIFIDGDVHAGETYTYRVSAYSAIYGTSGPRTGAAVTQDFTAFVVPIGGSDSNNRPYADSPFATVQGALDYFYSTVGGKPAFAPGTDSGTIFVQSGTYTANTSIVLPGNISVQGGWDNSWNFDGSVADIRLNNTVDNLPVVTLSGDSNNLQYLSLTVLNSQANTVGVEVSAGSVTHSINDVIINSGNATSDTIGLRVLGGSATVNIYDSIIQSGNGNNSYAIDIDDAFQVNLSRSIVTPGTGASNSYGIFLDNGSKVKISDATIVNNGNAGTASYGIKAETPGSNVYVGSYSVIGSSASSPDSYGIHMGMGTNLDLYRSFINGGNTSSGSQSYGLFLDNAGIVRVNSNYIQGGSAAVSYGIQMNSATNATQVVFNTIEGGSGTTSSTAVSAIGGTSPYVYSNLLLSSSTGIRYGINYSGGASPYAYSNNFSNYLSGDALVFNGAAVTAIAAVNGIFTFNGNTDFSLDIDPATGQAVGNLLPADLVWGANATFPPTDYDLDGGPTRTGPNYTVGPYEVETDFNGYFFSNNTITVTNNGDNSIDSDYSQTSLREAVELVHKSSYYQRIQFNSDYTININAEIVINEPIIIDGNTDGDIQPDVVLDGGGTNRIFKFDDRYINGLPAFSPVQNDYVLRNLVLRNGQEAALGGAISIWSQSATALPLVLTLENCHFINNSVTGGDGGAVYIRSSNGSTAQPVNVNVRRSVFEGNQASGYSGGIYTHSTQTGPISLAITDSVFVNNRGDIGSSLHVRQGADITNATIDRSTFFSNLPISNALVCIDTPVNSTYVRDSIFWRTDPDMSLNESIHDNTNAPSTNAYLYNCIVDAGGAGTTGIDPTFNAFWAMVVDPQFVSVTQPDGGDGIWGNGNDGLRLRPDSPGISAAYITTSETDIQGFSRYSHTNLGAFENTGAGSVPFSVSAGNVSGPFNPRKYFNTVKAVGTTLYAGTVDGPLYIYDVSNPFNPTQTGFTDFGDTLPVLDIEYDPSGYLYIVKSDRVQIVDMSGNWINVLFDFGTYESVFISGGYLYASLGVNGIAVYDISNASGFASPADPALLPAFAGGYNGGGSFTAYDLWVENDYIFIADRDNIQRGRIDVMGDVTNPGGYNLLFWSDGNNYQFVDGGPSGVFFADNNIIAWVNKGTFDASLIDSELSTGTFNDLKIDGIWGYILDSDDGMNVLDLSGGTIGSSQLVSTRAEAVGLDIETGTNRAYLAEENGGIQIVDITTPAAAALTGAAIPAMDSALDIEAFNGAVFVAGGVSGLQVYDAATGDLIDSVYYTGATSAMFDPVFRVGHYYHEPTDTHYLAVLTMEPGQGNTLFLYTVNNADNTLTYRHERDVSSGAVAEDMDICGPNIIVATGNDELETLQINTATGQLNSMNTVNLGFNVKAVALSGNIVYAAANNPGNDLYTLDFDTLGIIDNTGSGIVSTINDLSVQGSTLVAVNNNQEFSIVDVRDPTVLVIQSTRTFAGANYTDSFIRENKLLLLDENNGIHQWDISNETSPINQGYLPSFSAYAPKQIDVDENGTFYIAGGIGGYIIFNRD